MKKLVSISMILFGLAVLINCSPKTAKKTASSETKNETVKRNDATGNIPAPEAVTIDNNVIREEAATTPPTSSAKGLANIINMPSDQQLTMFQSMAPMRVEMGHKMYTQNCGKCHKLHEANSRLSESWVQVMAKMGPKANLNTDQYLMIGGYLTQNAKK